MDRRRGSGRQCRPPGRALSLHLASTVPGPARFGSQCECENDVPALCTTAQPSALHSDPTRRAWIRRSTHSEQRPRTSPPVSSAFAPILSRATHEQQIRVRQSCCTSLACWRRIALGAAVVSAHREPPPRPDLPSPTLRARTQRTIATLQCQSVSLDAVGSVYPSPRCALLRCCPRVGGGWPVWCERHPVLPLRNGRPKWPQDLPRAPAPSLLLCAIPNRPEAASTARMTLTASLYGAVIRLRPPIRMQRQYSA